MGKALKFHFLLSFIHAEDITSDINSNYLLFVTFPDD